MHRSSHHRARGAVGIAVALLAAITFATAPSASADSLLSQKLQQRQHARAQLHALDLRAEALTEQYDHAVWQLHVLHGEIAAADARLAAARAELAQKQAMLSQLLVSQYKGGGVASQTMALVLGASSLSQVTAGLDFQQRFDVSVTDTVEAIAAARDEIRHERQLLVLDQRHMRRAKHEAEIKKQQIEKQMAARRRLVNELGIEVQLLERATTVEQGKTALDIRKSILQEEHVDATDPGQLIRDQVVLQGLEQVGVPYVWGGASPQGFDCSGLVMWLWARHGVSLPHFAAAQYALGPVIEKGPGIDLSKLQPGDLLFFHDLGHVGIYVGNGYILHAPHTGTTVQISPLSWGWFQSTFVGATRPGPA